MPKTHAEKEKITTQAEEGEKKKHHRRHHHRHRSGGEHTPPSEEIVNQELIAKIKSDSDNWLAQEDAPAKSRHRRRKRHSSSEKEAIKQEEARKAREEADRATYESQLKEINEENDRRRKEAAERLKRRDDALRKYRGQINKIQEMKATLREKVNGAPALSSDYTHTPEADIELEAIQTQYKNLEKEKKVFEEGTQDFQKGGEWSEWVNYEGDLQKVQEKDSETENKMARIQRKRKKALDAKERLKKHMAQKDVVMVMETIRNASDENGGYSMIPGMASFQERQNQGQQNQGEQNQPKEKFSLKGFISKWGTKINNSADLINGILGTIGDFKGNNGLQQGSGGAGGILALLGSIKNAMGLVSYAKEMFALNKEDYGVDTKRIKILEGFNQVCDVLIGLISSIGGGIAGGLGQDPVSAILSIITNSITLLKEVVNLSASGARSRGIENRKEKIRAKLKEKYNKYSKEDSSLASYFNIGEKKRSETVKIKREQLREALAQENNGKLSIGGDTREVKKISNLSWLTSEKFKDTKETYLGYTTLSQKLAQNKARLKEADAKNSSTYAQDKRRTRMMEALNLLNQYYAEDEARDRQRKSRRSSWIEVAKSATSIGANIMKLFKGTGVDLAGSVVDLLVSAADKVQHGVQKIWAHRAEVNGHNNDKALRRNEIAESFFESIKELTTNPLYSWRKDIGFAAIHHMRDTYLISASDRVSEFAGMLHGTGVNPMSIVGAGSRGEIIQMLSNAYAQDQG